MDERRFPPCKLTVINSTDDDVVDVEISLHGNDYNPELSGSTRVKFARLNKNARKETEVELPVSSKELDFTANYNLFAECRCTRHAAKPWLWHRYKKNVLTTGRFLTILNLGPFADDDDEYCLWTKGLTVTLRGTWHARVKLHVEQDAPYELPPHQSVDHWARHMFEPHIPSED